MQRMPFALRVKVGKTCGSVVGAEHLSNPAISGAGHIAGRKVQQTRVIRLAYKDGHIHCGVYIRCQRISQIWIEIGQTRTIDDEIKLLLQRLGDFRRKPQVRLANVALDHLHSLPQKS